MVTEYITKLNWKYDRDAQGNKVPLTICAGENHEYLDMKLDYHLQGKVKIDMTKYTLRFLEDDGERFPSTQ